MNSNVLYQFASSLALGAGLMACATITPVELVDARQAYSTSEKGPAAQYAQSHLQVAKVALLRAEQSFEDDGAEPKTRDLAYIAQRQAQIADAQARVVIAKQEKADAERNLTVANKQIRNQTEDELSRTKEQLSQTEAQRAVESEQRRSQDEKLTEREASLEKTTAQLETEKQARMNAEKQAADARSELNRIAEVKDEERGMVIQLAGNVLFASGKSQLLTGSHVQLQQISKALKSMPGRRIMIEGHTDSVGSDATNQSLSQARADAVKAFMIRNGIDSSQIDAIGVGESRPVADNASAEGRANNRRVEIILQNPTS
jgi:outer membrane protein OmpA-like peptidoglycan-associated protein